MPLELRDTRQDAVISAGAIEGSSTSMLVTTAIVVVVGAAGAFGVSRLRRSESGGIGLLLAGWMATAVLAAFMGAALGEGLFQGIAVLAWCAFAITPLLLVGIASIRRTHRATFVAAWSTAAAIVAIGLHAFVMEPGWLEISHVEHRSAHVAREVTIALVADLQTDVPGSYERRVLAEVAAARPDLVLWAGDYLQIEDPVEYERAADSLRAIIREVGLDPPLGMFAVQGNAETRASWPELFEGTGVHALASSRRIEIGEGITLTALDLRDGFDTTLRVEPADGLHIVLAHAPDFALGDVQADLLLAGHTHGGQVRLPFIGPILTLSQVPRAWASGTTRLDEHRTLVVSRGIGMERGPAPRLRFLCRPELVFVHVRPTRGRGRS